MQADQLRMFWSQAGHRFAREIGKVARAHREKLPYLGVGVVILGAFILSKAREQRTIVYRNEGRGVYKEGRVLSYQGSSIYEGKERLFTKTVSGIQASEVALKDQVGRLQAQVEELIRARAVPTPVASSSPLPPSGASAVVGPGETAQVRVSEPPDVEAALRSSQAGMAPTAVGPSRARAARVGSDSDYRTERSRGGASILSFPVKDVAGEPGAGIVLPSGSYVKAKLMTGIEAPEGKTNPVLLQLDYAFIGPNRHRIDLSGCFMIAKSQGDLSTERVQMQASKLSCVSKDGKMFEREVSGFVADDKDNSFAVMGSVNSKQDRVAAMAFLSSIVEGVGKSIQQAQTTSQATPLGGSQSVVTGSSAEYMAAGGAANAASMVTQWYLRQAQNLLPTINIGSGQDVWIVMLETVKLPNNYFRKNSKGDSDEGAYLYLTRVLD